MTNEALREHMKARITPEKVDKARQRIGIPGKHRHIPFNLEAHPDTIRHYVNGCGDDNPLFCDAEYAGSSRWQGITAPLHYLSTMGERPPETPDWTQEQRAAMSGGDPLRGIHAFYSGMTWEWYRPIRPARRVYSQSALTGVIEKQSSFADLSLLLPSGAAYRDNANGETGDLIAWRESLMIHTERETAAKKGKYKEVERAQYAPDDIAAIDKAYANEFRRSAEPLYWEDVEIGPIARPMVKGPLVVTDIIFWHVGGNETAYNLSPLKLAWQNRQKIPAFYLPNAFGALDAAQRCHWDDELAQETGNPFAYDYGAMREAWVAHFLYNWMGDNAWLWKFHAEMRRFNYIGDVTWIWGEVTEKYEVDGPRFAVDIALRGENQRGETTTKGWATILLPSRSHDEIILPDPPGNARTIAELFEVKIADAQNTGEANR